MTDETKATVLEALGRVEADLELLRDELRRLRNEMAAFSQDLGRWVSERAAKNGS